ncbi:MAG: hypothetical protein A2179_07625 [Elusimicrobia bacterium GWC2_63_65]|nr:MAG: hypothetical protein A2179_07625 [Elusimicrobia bacterium GWC2_63_65]
MKYWAYVNNEILGPFEKEKLLELPNFSPSLLVCPQTPVGEKTEDWKEASTYPELSALIASGGASSPKPAAAPPAAAAPGSPLPGAAPLAFKPLTASSIDPVAPSDHKFGGVEIQANRLGKAPAAAPAPAQESQPVQQNSASFDPLTLSQVTRKAEEAFPAAAPEGGRPPEMETFTPTSAAQIGAARPPEMETFNRAAFPTPSAAAPEAAPVPAPAPEPAAAGAAPAGDSGALLRKLEALEKNAVSRQDISALVDPLRMKLDQMGEVISSIKNQQFQREIMDKLAYLESSLGDIKASMKGGAPAASPQPASIAPAQAKEPSGRTIFGATAAAAEEKPKAEPEAAPAIVDTGSKRSKLAAVFKKFGRLVITLVLLAAVALGAVIGLKNFGVFDATPFIPFPLPFVQSAAPAPSAEQQAAEQAAAEQQAAAAIKELQGQAAGQEQAAPIQPAKDISPEIVYFTRTYKLKQDGPTLEDKLVELSKAAGGDYARVDWKVKQGVENIFEIAAVIPSKAGSLAYTFVADYGKKTLLPADAHGTEALEALAGQLPPKQLTVTKRGSRAGAGKRTQARKPAAQVKKAPVKKAAPAPEEDEYEYEYEDEDEEAGE